MEKIVCQNKNKSLVAYVLSSNIGINFSTIQKLLRTKQIKVNGKRIKCDQGIDCGDVIELFYNPVSKNIEIVFEDANIIVVNKPIGIEVIDENNKTGLYQLKNNAIANKQEASNNFENKIKGNADLISQLENQTNCSLYAVHRLDRNTAGLVVFAKNKDAQNKLLYAFKHHKVEKTYLAIVVGVPAKNSDRMIAYLKKDSLNSMSYVSDIIKDGYEKIVTSYKLIKTNDILSLLEVQIETGKTHQIRAHLAHIGFPILGDEKYGNKQINRQFGKKKQILVAYKLDLSKVFDIPIISLPQAMENLLKLV